MKLCVVCGEPCLDGRCSEHRPEQPTKLSPRQRGYTPSWDKLSARARRIQPWCSDCGTMEDLTADHLTWPARTLVDVDVVCRSDNSKRGAARSLATGTGVEARPTLKDPRAKANFRTVDRLHIEGSP